jgi:hypothetical protein
MSPRSSWPLWIGKCHRNEGKIEFFTDEHIHMVAIDISDDGISKEVSMYIFNKVTGCLGEDLGHFGWGNVQKKHRNFSF